MKFEKEFLFLGMTENTLSDGGIYYTVDMYVQESGSVKVNVMGSNRPVMDSLIGKKFGTPMKGLFELAPKEKLYRLKLVAVYA